MTRIIYKNRWGVECEVDASEIVSVEGFAGARAMSGATLETGVEGLVERLNEDAQACETAAGSTQSDYRAAAYDRLRTDLSEAATTLSRLSEQVKALEGERDEARNHAGAERKMCDAMAVYRDQYLTRAETAELQLSKAEAERDEARSIARRVPEIEFDLKAAQVTLEITEGELERAQGRLQASEARATRAEGERDEALQLAEVPSTLKDLAALAFELGHLLSSAEAQMKGMREALITARDLLLERIQGSPARSAAHNARLVIEAALEKSAAKP